MRLAGTAAVKGGSIFSGDFTSGLQPIIEDALQAFYDDFQDAEGFEAMLAGLTTQVDYTQTAIADNQDCDDTKALWSTLKDEGIQKGIPFASLTNLITGALPSDDGTIFFLGHDITHVGQRRIAAAGIARTFQHVKLRTNMSLVDNVLLGTYLRTGAGFLQGALRLDRAEEARARAEALRQLERVGLGGSPYEPAGNRG